REYQRRWLAAHREEYNAKHREYYQQHREALREYNREYQRRRRALMGAGKWKTRAASTRGGGTRGRSRAPTGGRSRGRSARRGWRTTGQPRPRAARLGRCVPSAVRRAGGRRLGKRTRTGLSAPTAAASSTSPPGPTSAIASPASRFRQSRTMRASLEAG